MSDELTDYEREVAAAVVENEIELDRGNHGCAGCFTTLAVVIITAGLLCLVCLS